MSPHTSTSQSADGPRVVLVTGKGGVGKTTSAAALAVGSARSGLRTLLMSTDPAHSLADALDIGLSTATTWRDTTPVEPGLEALAVDSATAVEAAWETVQAYLLTLLESIGVDPVVADELTRLPGADEISALMALDHQCETGDWDVVVVDCAPTSETLRLLALPEILAWHLDRLLPAQRRMLVALRPAAAAATGVAMPGVEVMQVLRAWRRRMGAVRARLTSPSASVRLVLTPEQVVIAEGRRVLTSLGLHGYAVDRVIVNRVIPVSSEPWQAAWNHAQAEGLETIRESFTGIPVAVAPYLAGEPTGADALAALDARTALVEGVEPPLTAAVSAPGMTVVPDGLDFVLTLPVPYARSGDVDLHRRGDDLVITVGGDRRVLALPSVLRRCIVTTAQVGRSGLKVRFQRDEEMWPRAR